MHKFKGSFMCIWYAALMLLVFAPLFKPGYILTLDMVFTPVIRMPLTVNNSYLAQVFLHEVNYVLPSYVIEKTLLAGILLLAGIGLHRLVLRLAPKADAYQSIGAYIAGTLYIINPFTYDRFMAGQYDVVFGYALLPWFTSALVTFLANPKVRTALTVTAWALLSSIVSIHSIGFMVILAVIAATVTMKQRYHDIIWRRNMLVLGTLAIVIYLVASIYWLLPLITGQGSTAANISSFGPHDLHAFATIGGNWLSQVGNVLRLQGFWVEARDMYNPPQQSALLGGVLLTLIWALIIAGAIVMWRAKQRSIVLLFVGSSLVAIVLATGPLIGLLAAHIPFISGYREPQKFVALIVLGYSVFMSRGAAVAIRYAHQKGGTAYYIIACVLLTLLPAVWTPTLWWGFNHQLSPVQYPADWYAVNRRLNHDHNNFNTVFLPWHLYMYFNFAHRIIVNPAQSFFDKPVIVSDNPEYKDASLSNSTPIKRQLDQLLPQANTRYALGAQLAKFNIKYVILDKDDDYMDYAYLRKQYDLRLITNGDTLEVFVNTAWRKQ